MGNTQSDAKCHICDNNKYIKCKLCNGSSLIEIKEECYHCENGKIKQSCTASCVNGYFFRESLYQGNSDNYPSIRTDYDECYTCSGKNYIMVNCSYCNDGEKQKYIACNECIYGKVKCKCLL